MSSTQQLLLGEGAGGSGPANYIEDVFSTYLYAGAGATQTITNGIDLAGKGGLVWIKNRTLSANWHVLNDTVRGTQKEIYTNSTAAQATLTTSGINQFNANGFQIVGNTNDYNGNTSNYVSWTFRKQPKFFDVVTYTGNGVGGRQIPHNLGSVPGCIIVKVLSEAGFWRVWHRAIPGDTNQTSLLALNSTQEAELNQTNVWAANGITSTYFTASTSSPSNINGSGNTYVAYLFAHDAGGFGLTGTDNVISCGSFVGTGTANTPTVTLGYEPQWLLIKKIDGTISTSASSWTMWDTMRGITTGGNDSVLWANLTDAESTPNAIQVTSTGFQIETSGAFYNQSGATYIYIAIRRGPMKVPTSGTSVFTPSIRTGTGTTTTVSSTSFPPDLYINGDRTYGGSNGVFDRLRGRGILQSFSTAAENATSPSTYDFVSWGMNGEALGAPYNINMTGSGRNFVDWNFGRAPSFMDVVCGTSASSGQTWTSNHNLGVSPELVIMKTRGSASSPDDYWWAAQVTANKFGILNTNASMGAIGSTLTVSATSFTGMVGYIPDNTTMVAYLFATCAGVSKVGSYTGNGSSQTINCGFTGGARFVLIKRTNATGDWCVWDTARGMVSGTDPRLFLNSSSAEYNNDWVYTTTGGFQIVTSDTNVNASGSTYIYLAIA